MKLIVWLGNPGTQYELTRHNAGRLALGDIVDQFDGTSFLYQEKFLSEVATGMIDKRQVIYAKPNTYMNKSGSAVRKIAKFYDITSDDILVIHDDIDHISGKIKLKYSGSHAGQKWVKDIIEKLGTKQFRRLKLWVGRPSNPKYDISDYVLGKMWPDELKYRADARLDICEQVQQWLKNVG